MNTESVIGNSPRPGESLDVIVRRYLMKTCTKKENVLTDVQLVAEPPDHLFRYRYNLTPQKRQEILKGWVREFHEFIRDHRSADPVNLSVEQTRKDLCSACDSEWETYEEEGKTCCAHCGAVVEEDHIPANDQMRDSRKGGRDAN